MMIRGLTVSLLFAVLATPAYAQVSGQDSGQTNPDTRQTDRSEEDWRNSRKKRDSGDIFDDIVTNPNSQGSGGIWGGEVKAIDRLSQESRRHLNRQRAKALAEAQPGEPIDAAYEPSEEAKSDEYVAQQEQRAWEEMVREANSGLGGIADAGQGDSAQQSGGKSGQGQTGQGQAGQGQTGQNGSQGDSAQGQSGENSRRNSPLRGGSASSASDILNQIKGRGSASGPGQGQSPASGQGTAQAPGQQAGSRQADGQSENAAQGQATTQADAQNQGDNASDAASPPGAEAQAQADAQAAAQNDAAANAAAAAQAEAQAQAAAAAEAQAAAETAAQAAAHAETISPLERLKRDPVERSGTGGRTSASDYLKKKRD